MLQLGSGKCAQFEQVAMADIGSGVEKELPARSKRQPRQSVKNIEGMAGHEDRSGKPSQEGRVEINIHIQREVQVQGSGTHWGFVCLAPIWK